MGRFADDNEQSAFEYTSILLKYDEAVALLAKAFTTETWSQGMGLVGLADRVAIRTPQAMIERIDHIVDTSLFRKRLEELEQSKSLDKI
jgi:hypothetical protein